MPSGSSHAAEAAAFVPRDRAADLAHLDKIAHQLDARFRIPGTEVRFGWDTLVGLIPGVGDVATAGASLYLIAVAHRMGARKRTLTRMLGNAGVDWVIGSIPFVGDLFDLVFKANKRNVALLRRELETGKARG